jgi:hypothetical protein
LHEVLSRIWITEVPAQPSDFRKRLPRELIKGKAVAFLGCLSQLIKMLHASSVADRELDGASRRPVTV